MTEVTREQFVFDSDLKVRHIPTGATLSTYRFDGPNDFALNVENAGRAGDRLENGEEYEHEDIKVVGAELLRECQSS